MSEIEVSVVIPCLNESATVGICVEKALRTMKELGLSGEVVVADNGSTDDSVAVAERAGARVVHQKLKGYGNAYLKGFAEAKGKYLIMGDADDSYDFTDLERFIRPLQDGKDMVMGTRIKGEIIKGAMPPLHRYFGVPVLTGMLNLLFCSGFSDAHCGMRSFTREAYDRMHLTTTGMEFASEMIIKAAQAELDSTEIPITLHPDGRPGKPHLKSFTDGWRHVRFMLNYKPSVLYFFPGGLLLVGGLSGLITSLIVSLNTVLYVGLLNSWAMMCGLSILAGYSLLILGVIAHAKNYTGFFPKPEKFIKKFFTGYKSGSGILTGIVASIAGIILLLTSWGSTNSTYTIMGILGAVLSAMGIITIFVAFLLGQLNIFGKE